MLKDNPVMKKLVETGEERVGKLAQQLLSNERFVAAVQTLVSRSLAAKGTLDGALKGALGAMNLPSSADVEALRSKVEDLERLLASVESKVASLAGEGREKH
jgi:polyhydroxyalkanoate synthesis regulator phasin